MLEDRLSLVNSVIFPVAHFAVYRHWFTLECAFVTFYDFRRKLSPILPDVAEVMPDRGDALPDPDISFLIFSPFFVLSSTRTLWNARLRLYRSPRDATENIHAVCEDRVSLRQQAIYRPRVDPEVVVSKPGSYAVYRPSSTCSALGTERYEASVKNFSFCRAQTEPCHLYVPSLL